MQYENKNHPHDGFIVGDRGFEPLTSTTSKWRSTNWANRPIGKILAQMFSEDKYISEEESAKNEQPLAWRPGVFLCE